MEIKLAQTNDLPHIMKIIKDAKELLKKSGSLQWNTADGYPQESVFINDINNKSLYVLLDDNSICGVITCVNDIDPNYNEIKGHWITNGPYLAIHRVAVKKEYYGTGISHRLIEHSIDIAKKLNCKSIRADTHQLNIPMQKLLLHFNFKYCGEIKLLDREVDFDRIAYELEL